MVAAAAASRCRRPAGANPPNPRHQRPARCVLCLHSLFWIEFGRKWGSGLPQLSKPAGRLVQMAGSPPALHSFPCCLLPPGARLPRKCCFDLCACKGRVLWSSGRWPGGPEPLAAPIAALPLLWQRCSCAGEGRGAAAGCLQAGHGYAPFECLQAPTLFLSRSPPLLAPCRSPAQ